MPVQMILGTVDSCGRPRIQSIVDNKGFGVLLLLPISFRYSSCVRKHMFQRARKYTHGTYDTIESNVMISHLFLSGIKFGCIHAITVWHKVLISRKPGSSASMCTNIGNLYHINISKIVSANLFGFSVAATDSKSLHNLRHLFLQLLWCGYFIVE